MASFNKIIIAGNLTKDPEAKTVGEQTVCKFTIASNRYVRDAKDADVCFVEIDVWGKQADACKLYLAKGRPVLVEGRLKFNTWKDQDGNLKSKHSIYAESVVFLNASSKEDSGAVDKSALLDEDFSKVKSNSTFKDKNPFEDLPF